MSVISIESPYSAPTESGREQNIRYAILATKHAALCGDAPFASHLLLTQTVNKGRRDYVSDDAIDQFDMVKTVS